MVDEETRNTWVIMSERTKGLDIAMDEQLPEVSRSVCARHLYANFKQQWLGDLMKNYFWVSIKAHSPYVFLKAMAQIKKNNTDAYNYLNDVPLELWARHMFDQELKSKEDGRLGWGDGYFCKLIASSYGVFEVKDGNVYFCVDLNKWTCSLFKDLQRFHTSNSRPNMWPVDDQPRLTHPELTSRVGRPKTDQRHKEKGETPKMKRSTIVRSSICQCLGHNKRGCQGGETTKQKLSKLNNSGNQTRT
uniref:Uncharacterized protein n=1 Tax=Chenopodium quinoa TaxID=63459 RepID=A0A803N3U1_CHEQI